MSNASAYSEWREFARQNDLTFHPYNFWLLGNPYITGNYGVYRFRLETFTRRKESSERGWDSSIHTFTRMTLATNGSSPVISSHQKKRVSRQEFEIEQMVNLLIPTGANQITRGQFFAHENGREIDYEQENIVDDVKYLQLMLDSLKELIEVYPYVVELGGEAVPGLLPIAKRFHPLQHVAAQLLAEIGRITEKQLKQRLLELLCPSCLVHCGPHQITTPWTGLITYYGCKACGQSRELLKVENYRLIAVLDSAITPERIQTNHVIRVNWMMFPRLFDFDEVEIVQATDEEVERFAVQVGNDTDPIRCREYKQMRCTIRSNDLSENTLRILQHTFGQVEKKVT